MNKKMAITLKRLLLMALAFTLMQGCVDAAMTGAQVAYNHGHIQKTLSDSYITTQAYRKLYRDTDRFNNTNIAIATFHQEVLIAGQIPSKEKRNEVTAIIEKIPNVKKVYNLTQIAYPTSSLVRASDAWITSKIKTKLIAMNDIDPNQIKVVTENGTVFLMGMLLHDQANIAVDIARETDGVQNVVKIFTYLRISRT